MKRTTWLAFAYCAVAVFWVGALSTPVIGDKPKHDVDFAPKVLMIFCKDQSMNAVLGDVRVQKLGEKAFLVGRVLSPEWSQTTWKKAKQWVAIEHIVSMIEFSSVEDARKANAESLQKKVEKPQQ